MSSSQNEILSGLSNSAFLAVTQPPDPFSSGIKATQQSAINSDTYALLGTKAAPVTATQFNTGIFSSGVGSVTPDLVVSSITSGSGTAGTANVAPTYLQLNLNSSTLKTTDTLSLNGGWVYDANGYSDISKIDFWVQRADGSFVDVADATSFSAYAYDNKWAGFNYSLGLSGLNLGAGTTTLWAKAYDKSGASTDWLKKSFSVVKDNVGDWFDQNLKDVGIVAKTRELANDGSLSRNDIISIFRDAEDGNTIDANELTDFRTILTNSSRFAIQDYVKVLANKVANSDPANSRSGFGNLYAGISSTQLENLIGKWFLGTDRPDTSYTYRYTSGSLFQNGISADDIAQNQLGDCYFLATLSSIAQEKSSYIQNLFIDNGDSTFTVRFFNNGVADYVTVDRYLPTTSSGFSIYAGWGGGSYSSSTNELWVALAEKAYAQLGESGWSRPGNTSNAYSSIESGWMDYVIRQVTGLTTTSQSATAMTQSQLIDLVNSNKVLTVGFVYGGGYGVYDSHAYTITSYTYNSTKKAWTFDLRNPWGTSHANVTWDELQSLKGIVQWSNA